jgi:opacity protein-like surface antigen
MLAGGEVAMRNPFLALAWAALLAPAAARAQPVSTPAGTGPEVWIAFHLGASVAQGDDLGGKLEPGYDVGAAVGARFTPWLGIEGSASYVRAEGTSDGVRRTYWDVPLAVNLRARWPGKVVEPSISAGAALHLATLEADVVSTSAGARSTSATPFGFQVGAALDFHVTRTMLVGASVERSFVPAKIDDATVRLDALRLAVGLTHHF